jgi:hypothetical protein
MFRQWIFYGHRHRQRFFENLHETGITVFLFFSPLSGSQANAFIFLYAG